jgi:hypothetical protein
MKTAGDLATLLAARLAGAVIDGLISLTQRRAVLGGSILGFSGAGAGLIIGSYFVPGWWQAFLLALGTILLIVGTVEVGILGVLRKIIEPDEESSQTVKALDAWLNRPDVSLQLQYRKTGANPSEVAAALRELADRLDIGL